MSWLSGFTSVVSSSSDNENQPPPPQATLPSGRPPPRICSKCAVPAEKCEHAKVVCEKCKHPGATCTCQPFKIIGAATSSTEKKKALTVSEHIGTMVSFIESVSSGEVASESEKKIRAHLIEQGAKLAKQEHVLHEYTERGVVTDELRKQHSDAVQEWLAACHSFISVILRHPHFTEALAKFKETL